MKPKAWIPVALAVAVVMTGPAPAPAQTVSDPVFTQLESGFIFTMPGVDAAAALVGPSPGAQSADILFDQKVQGGTVAEENIARQVLLVGAGQNNAGIVTINQDAGNMTNQANIIAIAFGAQAGEVLLTDVWGTQELTGNSATVRDSGPRETRIEDSFHGTTGIVAVNQSAGNFNQQVNALAVAVGFSVGPEFVALGDSTLGALGTEADNALVEEGTQGPRTQGVADSFSGFHGIAQVNQTTGDLNRVANVMGVSVVGSGLP